MPAPGLIFDFDGVIADSEALANTVLADAISRLGRPSTLDDVLSRYMGKRWPDVIALIESDTGRAVPDGFSDDLKADILRRFRAELRETPGAGAFIRRFAALPHCIASSSSPDRLQVSLAAIGMTDSFGGNVFSAELVERGKPHPDIFLLAAERIGVAPGHCIVIEDSASGVHAGRAAGMTVIGLSVGSHCRAGHADKLSDAGAHHSVATWHEVHAIVSRLLGD